MNKTKIRVMIVDDSQVARDLLTFIINSSPILEVAGYAIDGLDALKQIKTLKPDVITMDIEMPKMNGYETTQKIMETSPIPIIIVTASYHAEEVEKSFKAIQAGALAIMEKPRGPSDPNYGEIAKEIQETIMIVSELKLIRRRDPCKNMTIKPKNKQIEEETKKGMIQAVGIGASLGGPQAIAKILEDLPGDFPVPLFIVQHISMGFIDGLVNWLRSVTKLNITVAKDMEIAKPGTVYLAPETADMEISPGNVIHLKKAAPSSVHPSAAPMFASMAKTYGHYCVGVILTGMGKDGAAELLQMKNCGAITIAQDEESCVVFGMPKEAIALGGVKYILPLGEIASFLKQIIGNHYD